MTVDKRYPFADRVIAGLGWVAVGMLLSMPLLETMNAWVAVAVGIVLAPVAILVLYLMGTMVKTAWKILEDGL